MSDKQRVLIIGGTGMLGHVLLRELSQIESYDVYATARSPERVKAHFGQSQSARFVTESVDANHFETLVHAFGVVRPHVVVNCVGIIKQLPIADDPLTAIGTNALLPHRIALLCKAAGARFIHVSTDCVFDGEKGMYREDDHSNARDLYGRTKFLGEVTYPHCVTLRTSIIGHELSSRYGLIEWFLSQRSSVSGFRRAIYSGFSTLELSRIIHERVLPNHKLAGLYHVSSHPIAKYDLLRLVAERYRKDITISPNDDFVQDRSLDSTLFRGATGYEPPSWESMIERMHLDFVAHRDAYAAKDV